MFMAALEIISVLLVVNLTRRSGTVDTISVFLILN